MHIWLMIVAILGLWSSPTLACDPAVYDGNRYLITNEGVEGKDCIEAHVNRDKQGLLMIYNLCDEPLKISVLCDKAIEPSSYCERDVAHYSELPKPITTTRRYTWSSGENKGTMVIEHQYKPEPDDFRSGCEDLGGCQSVPASPMNLWWFVIIGWLSVQRLIMCKNTNHKARVDAPS